MNKPESVKLEVFSITLNPIKEMNNENSFRDLFEKTIGIDSNSNLFGEFADLFANHLDLGYTEVRNKAFTLSTSADDWGINLSDNCLWGVLKGGSKGSGKTKSPIVNREEEEDLKESVINDKFFFYLYTPLDENKAYLFFQVYGNESIRSEFIQHITDLFKISQNYNKPKTTPILPNSIKDEFKSNCEIVELIYQNKFLSSSFAENPEFVNMHKDYDIEISIKPKGEGIVPSNKLPLINEVMSMLQFNGNPLLNSKKKKATFKNLETKKTSTFQLDVSDVMPRIYLKGRVGIDEFGTPNFDDLKAFCDDLLEELVLSQYERITRN